MTLVLNNTSMKILLVLILPILFFLSCAPDRKLEIEKWKNEIMDTELAFAEMAKKKGVAEAFMSFAADDAVLMRNDMLIIGKEAVKDSFKENGTSVDASLSWSPDFVDVSSSGDLGYTYGKYVYTFTDSLGTVKSDEGVFHTVWKRQADGTWKFVWD